MNQMNRLIFKHKKRTNILFIKNNKPTKEQLRIKKSIDSIPWSFKFKDNLFWYYKILASNAIFLGEKLPKELNGLEILSFNYSKQVETKRIADKKVQWHFSEDDWQKLLF
jgi:hypothetical protein